MTAIKKQSLPKYRARVSGTIFSAFALLAPEALIAQVSIEEQTVRDEAVVPLPEAEVMSNGELRITTPVESHASRIADGELLQSIFQNPESVIGKKLFFETGREVGVILDLKRKIDDQFLYLVVDATPFFNAEATFAVAAKNISQVRDEIVLLPMAEGMHLLGINYYPEEYVAYDENFVDERVDEIFDETLSEDESE